MPKETVSNKHKHLTLTQRNIIELGITNHESLESLSFSINKHPSTLIKEIHRHATFSPSTDFNHTMNRCERRKTCVVRNLCDLCDRNIPCKQCDFCSAHCPAFQAVACPELKHYPFVCNACNNRKYCRLPRAFYYALSAHNQYTQTLKQTRTGYNLTETQLNEIDKLVSPLILNGQSIAHIYANHKDDLPICRKSLYNYIENNLLSVINLDLPRKVTLKPRHKRDRDPFEDASCRIGRTYTDYLNFLSTHPEMTIVEMDTVEGAKGGKVLLTLYWVAFHFMLIYGLEQRKICSVVKIFDHLEECLGPFRFKQLFPLILCDNGSEFKAPSLIEYSPSGERRSRIFYCDAGAAYQKGALERNHEYIRYILPKGSSFEFLQASDIHKLVNHINSASRDSLNGKTPYQLVSLLWAPETLEQLDIHAIKPDKVCLKPTLFTKKNS